MQEFELYKVPDNPVHLTEEFFLECGFKKEVRNWSFEEEVEFTDQSGQIIITHGITNRNNCYWYVHFDNNDFESIGSAHIEYYHELVILYKLFGYDLKSIKYFE